MFSKPYLKNYFLFIFFLSSFGKSWGQNNFSIPLKIGYGFNSSISLNEDETSNVNGIIIQSGLEYEFKIYKNLFAETGLAGRAILASGKTENSSYKAKTLRLRLPVKLGWTISEKWKVASGIAIQNNKDFITIDLREKYFWRYDLLFEGKYNWVKNWFGVASINYELRNLPNAYFINDPRFVISLGVGRGF
tara:strand:- start:170 stop:742 length:573 start_codon:yes stop_codon:yes gene_type:complete